VIRDCKVWLSQILILPQRLAGSKRIDRGIIMFQFQRWIVCVDFWPTVLGGWWVARQFPQSPRPNSLSQTIEH